MAARQMIRVDVGFQDPAQLEPAPFDGGKQRFKPGMRHAGALGLIVQHGIDDHRLARGRIGYKIGPGVGGVVEKGGDVRAAHGDLLGHDIRPC